MPWQETSPVDQRERFIHDHRLDYGIGSCGVPRPSLADYVIGTGATGGATAAAVLVPSRDYEGLQGGKIQPSVRLSIPPTRHSGKRQYAIRCVETDPVR